MRDVTVGKPFFISGGIQPDDVDHVKEFARDNASKGFFAVDINSRFEISPGIKDMKKVKTFIQSLS